MIAIIDYGMGNLRSVQKALEFLGYEAQITSNKQKIKDSKKIILPGVGAFSDAIKALKASELDQLIIDEIKKGKYFLGICLGHQLLFETSYENGTHKGLALIEGEIVKFENPLYKIPQIGWNSLSIKSNIIWNDISNNTPFYFVHSYYAKCDEKYIIAKANYCNIDFVASVNKENIYGIQFHPEKSGDEGLKILKNFGELK